MATMTRRVCLLLLVVLASQCTSLHARSVRGDYDTQQYAPTHGGEYFPSKASDTLPSFATQDTANNYNYDASFAATDAADVPYDTFIESPETVTGTHQNNEQAVSFSQAQYANDEVYFDTSNAKTVYRANDGGLSLAAMDVMNATDTDEVLASLAKAMGGCGTGNPIDDCWRCDPNWKSHRQALATCAIGFGRNAIGGKNGPIYTVTNNGDDLVNPQPGTLRYGVTRNGPLWIIFANSMTIRLQGELWVTAFKTIDGRGADVQFTGPSQITIQQTNNVIVHGISIHDITPSGPATIRVSPTQVMHRSVSDGDGLHIWGSHDVWVDHCSLVKATDGLLDVTEGSTMVTVSNNYFANHDKVMLLGAKPSDTMDRNMRVTVAFNKFGPGLIQRLPRCRFGVFHVVNNDYSSGWSIYAIGGSEDPTILSQGNYFSPSGNKEVTKRINDNGPMFGGWQSWNWASGGDVFLNGAYFVGSGAKATSASVYAQAFSTSARPANLVPALTKSAGPLTM